MLPGVGTASTRPALELTRAARALKAAGVLVVSPYYNRPTQEGLFQHFKAVAEVGLPVMLYNIPGRCGVDVALDTMERLAKLPGIVSIKEATGNVIRSADILARFGSRFTVLSGDDGITLPIMSVGGSGVVSVASNAAPRDVAQLVKLYRSGDTHGARVLAEKLRPLFEVVVYRVEARPGEGGARAARPARRRRFVALVWPNRGDSGSVARRDGGAVGCHDHCHCTAWICGRMGRS